MINPVKRQFNYFLLCLAMIWMKTSFGQIKIEGLHYLDHTPVSVEITDGKIADIRRIEKLSDGNQTLYIAPGLIDNQVNGYLGVSFVFGGSELTIDGIKKATAGLWEKGVTTYLPTLTTNSRETLLKNLRILAKAKNDPSLRGSLAGFHLEGPYISPLDGFRGAHPKQHVRKPDWNEFEAFLKASGNGILTVTLAPELDGALEFIRQCSARGIIVALGHHNASKDLVDQAVLNGARISTHLGNGCANLINRHDNPLWPQLANDRLLVSLICDGFHLRDEEIKTFYAVKGPERTILTSDITSFAGLPAGKYINEDGETIELTEDGLLRYPAQDVLYGSATPINRGLVRIMNVTGCTLAEAIRMGSANPAGLYGLTDRGEMAPGKRADLILFTIDKRELNIKKTYVEGTLVYEAEQ
ncbi:N-acetylglucosamine-6-phosphate deacetylase [Gaoshiqia sp. Z1-71]|uniref:N-acetylglucosamine-6-phosphate deacetylase n=1 Tax=Gaoshiqia hydrogeniformans TaxID=3290090 RepID=UPI003BF7F570